MSSTPQDANAFHAGKSPNGQQRTDATGFPPQLTVCQSRPHCLRRFYHARTVTGREYHCSLCGLWRNRELPDILSRHLSLSAFRQVMAYRCTRLCSSQSQRGSIWRMIIRLTRNNSVFATQRKTGCEDFVLSPCSPWGTAIFPSIQKTFLIFL